MKAHFSQNPDKHGREVGRIKVAYSLEPLGCEWMCNLSISFRKDAKGNTEYDQCIQQCMLLKP